MDGFGIAVLGGLDQKHHEESDDGSASIDNEQPSVGEGERRTGDGPNNYHDTSEDKRPRGAHGPGGVMGEFSEILAHGDTPDPPQIERWLRWRVPLHGRLSVWDGLR